MTVTLGRQGVHQVRTHSEQRKVLPHHARTTFLVSAVRSQHRAADLLATFNRGGKREARRLFRHLLAFCFSGRQRSQLAQTSISLLASLPLTSRRTRIHIVQPFTTLKRISHRRLLVPFAFKVGPVLSASHYSHWALHSSNQLNQLHQNETSPCRHQDAIHFVYLHPLLRNLTSLSRTQFITIIITIDLATMAPQDTYLDDEEETWYATHLPIVQLATGFPPHFPPPSHFTF